MRNNDSEEVGSLPTTCSTIMRYKVARINRTDRTCVDTVQKAYTRTCNEHWKNDGDVVSKCGHSSHQMCYTYAPEYRHKVAIVQARVSTLNGHQERETLCQLIDRDCGNRIGAAV